jgi:hypothetical protein
MHEWERLQQLGREEMQEYPVGAVVSCRFMPGSVGKIIEQRAPWGILSPSYRVEWSAGAISGWLSASELKVKTENYHD